jgi:hypothetical protein
VATEGNAMRHDKSHQIFVDVDAGSSCRFEAGYLFGRMKDIRSAGQPVKLGGATGRTQVEVYKGLLRRWRSHAEEFGIKGVEVFFLDEYFGAAPLYYAYARQHLRVGKAWGFNPENIWVPRGCFFDPAGGGRLVNSAMLDKILRDAGGEWEGRRDPVEGPEIYIRADASHPVLKEIRDSNRAYDRRVREQGAGRLGAFGSREPVDSRYWVWERKDTLDSWNAARLPKTKSTWKNRASCWSALPPVRWRPTRRTSRS